MSVTKITDIQPDVRNFYIPALGLERRLLASVRWTLATNLAFPQISEWGKGSNEKTTRSGGFLCYFVRARKAEITIAKMLIAIQTM